MVKVILGSFSAFPILSKLVSRKRLAVERNGVKFGPGEMGVFSVYRVLLTVAWGHSGVIRCISDFWQGCISKMAGRRAKRSEIWVSGWVFSVYRVLLTVKCLRSFWGHLVHFRFSKLVSWKRLVVEWNGVTFGPWGSLFSLYRVLLTVNWLRPVWGHSVYFLFRQPCISKTACP